MDENIFSFKSYKRYLLVKLKSPKLKRGVKSALAKALGCQPTYVSQVLHGHSHLSLEQADKTNIFFSHTDEQSHFFLLLVQKDRAGTKTLKSYFYDQIEEILKRRLILTQRLEKKESLNLEDQSTYYSSWMYSALHIALTVPELQSYEALSEYFRIPLKKVKNIVEFLISAGLAIEESGKLQVGKSQIRLGNHSPNIIKHHTNWRNQAIESLEREELEDLHYSGVVSLSSSDIIKIKELFMDAIREYQNVVKDSKEEHLVGVNIDFFNMKKSL